MSARTPIVIFHKDHQLDPTGVNAGAETATLALARELASQGERVFLAAQLPGAAVEGLAADGVTYVNLGTSFNTTRAFDCLEQQYNLSSYDLIVASRAQALLESRARPAVRTRIFITHEPSAQAFGVKPAVITEVADRVIAVSAAQRDLLIQNGGAPEKIDVVPNGANLDIFGAGDPQKRDYNRIVFVGALVVDKGVHILLEAFATLKQRFPKLTLDVYGSAAMWQRENYFDLGQARNIPGVKFHGAVPQQTIAAAFKSAGLLVLPSLYFDSFPLTVVEAQVSGLPVLGSVHGGMKEIVRDGVTGTLISDVSPSVLAREMAQLISSPERLKQMSTASLELIRTEFSWTRTARQLLKLIDDCGASPKALNKPRAKVGLLTTFNQRCGLATYASYLVNQIDADNITVLAENAPVAERVGEDAAGVVRCWTRGAQEFSALERALDENRIDILHLNCHYRFFDGPHFAGFLQARREKGLKVIAHIHNPYTLDEGLQYLVSSVDHVVVHKPENALEVIANGADPARVSVIEHGVECVEGKTREGARQRLGFPAEQKVVVCFGFVQVHKGIEEVIQAMQKIVGNYPQMHLYVVGGPHQEDSTSVNYYLALKNLVRELGLERHIHFSQGFVPEETVEDYLIAADAVVMNYRSQYFEASGAAARALGCGAPVITSIAPPFANLGEAVFHITSGYPLAAALVLVATQERLNRQLRQNALAFAKKYSWRETTQRLCVLYKTLSGKTVLLSQVSQAPKTEVNVTRLKESPEKKQPSQARPKLPTTGLRVLMKNRSNALTQRGGDTVVMERVAEGLAKLGVSVDIDVDGDKDVSDYDLVHLHNFATPTITEAHAKLCVDANIPYVVTTMYEDLPLFYNQMLTLFRVFEEYVKRGQPTGDWNAFVEIVKAVEPSSRWENAWTAQHAKALIASGERERQTLIRDYPTSPLVAAYRLGCNVSSVDVSPELFQKETGIRDFVLCVGRLETRKNQLMLLKALEDSDVTVVFAGGGFTYQPEYVELCKKFKRKGKTVFVERLSAELLASAYAAARVHALPSWYELPGIVSMEAARYGTNVVVTDNGTARDYFGNTAYYCVPDDADSVRDATLAAFHAPTRKGLAELASGYSWDLAAADVYAIYEQVLGASGMSRAAAGEIAQAQFVPADTLGHVVRTLDEASYQASAASKTVSKICESIELVSPKGESSAVGEALCDEADKLLRQGKSDEAWMRYIEAVKLDPHRARAPRSCGVVCLQREDFSEAREWFERALSCEARDNKSIIGLGSSWWGQGEKEKAFRMFAQAVENEPNEWSALFHLVNACYSLERLDYLEPVLLRNYQANPDSKQIQYCLAGCYFKLGKLDQAEALADKLLVADAAHAHARELKDLIAKERKKHETAPTNTQSSKTSVMPKRPNPIDMLLQELELLKREKAYEALEEKALEVTSSSEATADQIALGLIYQAEAMVFTEKLDQADRQFQTVEENKAFGFRALAGRGAIAAAREQWTEARALFERSRNRVATYDVALAGLGMCAIHSGEREKAWELFQAALKQNPENLRAIYGIVELGYQLKRLEGLGEVLNNYLDYHPANISILYASAGCYYAQHKFDSALERLDTICLLDPAHEMARELREKVSVELAEGGSATPS